MSEFTKVTVIGSARKATLVVPSTDPVGAHLSDLAALLNEPISADAGPLALVTPFGIDLDPQLSLTDQDIFDGAVLHLAHADELPPPPEVSDVTDVVADVRDTQVASWGGPHRVTLGALVVGALTFAAAMTLVGAWAWVVSAGVFLLGGVLAVMLGLLGRSAAATLATASTIGAGVALAIAVVGFLPGSAGHPGVLVGAIATIVWLALGIGFGVGGRSAGALVGAGAGVVLAAAATGMMLAGIDGDWVAAVMAVVIVAVLGLVPSLVLAWSGVTSLDDRAIAGELPQRDAVVATTSRAYRMLSWALFAIAPAAAFAGGWLAASSNIWAALLGVAVIVVLLTRTRVVPLGLQAWPLWVAGLAAAAIGLTMSPLLPLWARVVLIVIASGLAVSLTLARPAAHVRVRLRRIGDKEEALAIVAIAP